MSIFNILMSSFVFLEHLYYSVPLYLQLLSSTAWLCSLCLTLSLKSTTTVLLTQSELDETSEFLLKHFL